MHHSTLKNPPAGAAPAGNVPPELELVLACARWPQSAADRELIRLEAAKPVDWRLFLLLAQHHRLVPLVFTNLGASMGSNASCVTAASATLEQLRQLAAANTYQALRSLSELRRVVQQLEAQGVPIRVLKGLPLAQTVFRDLSLRATGDLDLLIDEADLLAADRVLRELGYRPLFQMEHLTGKRLAFYQKHWKDVAYHNPVKGFEVDLHWRCFRNREMPGTSLCATSGRQVISFGGFKVETMPATETLLYLCVHGTLDGWLYFKSLADVAAQVRTMPKQELDALAEAAARYGVLAELSAALLLVRRYFTMDSWSSGLLGEDDGTVGHILRFADCSLVGQGFLATREEMASGKMMAFEIGLRRSVRYRFELLLRVLFRARMWETIPLPDLLFGLYPLLSPLEWLVLRFRRWWDKPSSNAAGST